MIETSFRNAALHKENLETYQTADYRISTTLLCRAINRDLRDTMKKATTVTSEKSYTRPNHEQRNNQGLLKITGRRRYWEKKELCTKYTCLPKPIGRCKLKQHVVHTVCPFSVVFPCNLLVTVQFLSVHVIKKSELIDCLYAIIDKSHSIKLWLWQWYFLPTAVFQVILIVTLQSQLNNQNKVLIIFN